MLHIKYLLKIKDIFLKESLVFIAITGINVGSLKIDRGLTVYSIIIYLMTNNKQSRNGWKME